MATQLVIPSLGLTMEEGIILEWLKREGDAVEKEEPVVLIETDKATVEVNAPTAGIVGDIRAAIGEAVPVGNAIATIYSEAEYATRPALPASEANAAAAVEEASTLPEIAPVAAIAAKTAAPEPEPAMPVVSRQEAIAIKSSDRIIASPAARKRSRELGVDLRLVNGTGPGGRILESNVLAYAAQAGARQAIPAAKSEPSPRTTFSLSGMRKLIAKRMIASRQTTASVTIMMDVRMDEAVRLRAQMNAGLAQTQKYKLTYDAMFVKAVATALQRHPVMQLQWGEDQLLQPERIDIGFAVALPDGLVVPVVRQADEKSLLAIAEEIGRLASQAKENRLLPEEMGGGAMTISNLGLYPVGGFTPVINLPENAILGIGAISPQPVVDGDSVTVGQVVTLSLTFDHRIVDGAPAAAFMTQIKSIMEQPYQLFMEP